MERDGELWWTDAAAGPSASSLAARRGFMEGRRTGLPGARAADEVVAAAATATIVDEASAMDEAEMATPDALD